MGVKDWKITRRTIALVSNSLIKHERTWPRPDLLLHIFIFTFTREPVVNYSYSIARFKDLNFNKLWKQFLAWAFLKYVTQGSWLIKRQIFLSCDFAILPGFFTVVNLEEAV